MAVFTSVLAMLSPLSAQAAVSDEALSLAREVQKAGKGEDNTLHLSPEFSQHYAGVIVDELNASVTLYSTPYSSSDFEKIEQAAPPSVVVSTVVAKFSRIQEEEAVSEFMKVLETVSFQYLVKAFPIESGGGFFVEVASGEKEKVAKLLSDFDEVSKVSGHIQTLPEYVPTADRNLDSAPYHGGAAIGVGLGGSYGSCTTGFGVKNALTGVPYLLTAGHCFHGPSQSGLASIGVYSDSKNWLNPYSSLMGTWKNTSGYNDPSIDAALIRPNPSSSSNRIFIGSTNSGTTRLISAAMDPVVGETVCVEGSATGEHCQLKIRSVDGKSSTLRFGDGTYSVPLHNIAETYASTTTAVGEGDSGGPIYDFNSGSQTYVGLGTASGGSGQFPCPYSDGFCYYVLDFSQLPGELASLGMEVN